MIVLLFTRIYIHYWWQRQAFFDFWHIFASFARKLSRIHSSDSINSFPTAQVCNSYASLGQINLHCSSEGISIMQTVFFSPSQGMFCRITEIPSLSEHEWSGVRLYTLRLYCFYRNMYRVHKSKVNQTGTMGTTGFSSFKISVKWTSWSNKICVTAFVQSTWSEYKQPCQQRK